MKEAAPKPRPRGGADRVRRVNAHRPRPAITTTGRGDVTADLAALILEIAAQGRRGEA